MLIGYRRLPGCPNTCSKLLQAALQSQDAAGVQAQLPGNLQHPSPDVTEQLHGDAHMEEEAEQAALLQPPAHLQQVAFKPCCLLPYIA